MNWVDKYKPCNLSEVQAHASALAELKLFVENYQKGSKAIILYGPTGVGKTCSVHALAKEFDLEMLEVNASDQRNKAQIEEKIGPAISQMSLFAKKKLILIDEIDGLSGHSDRGGVQAITTVSYTHLTLPTN